MKVLVYEDFDRLSLLLDPRIKGSIVSILFVRIIFIELELETSYLINKSTDSQFILERRYMDAYEKNPIKTDIKYCIGSAENGIWR